MSAIASLKELKKQIKGEQDLIDPIELIELIKVIYKNVTEDEDKILNQTIGGASARLINMRIIGMYIFSNDWNGDDFEYLKDAYSIYFKDFQGYNFVRYFREKYDWSTDEFLHQFRNVYCDIFMQDSSNIQDKRLNCGVKHSTYLNENTYSNFLSKLKKYYSKYDIFDKECTNILPFINLLKLHKFYFDEILSPWNGYWNIGEFIKTRDYVKHQPLYTCHLMSNFKNPSAFPNFNISRFKDLRTRANKIIEKVKTNLAEEYYEYIKNIPPKQEPCIGILNEYYNICTMSNSNPDFIAECDFEYLKTYVKIQKK